MQKNEIFRLKAENLGADMEGVCRKDGMPVFVPGLLPGEETDVRIVKVEKRFAFGRMETPPAEPSPERKDPGCPAYPRCGGCSCRHMRYEATLEAKRRQVQDCLERIGGIRIDVPPVLGMDHPNAYRNKTALPCAGTADAPVLGFFAPRSHTVIPADACPNAMAPGGKIAGCFLDWMRQHHIEPYREEAHWGLIRHLVVRVNREGQSMVTVAANGKSLPQADDLADRLKPLNVVSLFLNENTARTNVILSGRYHLIYGRETLPDVLCGLKFELSPGAFFQVNPAQTEILYETALRFAALSPADTLCDVYCGAGTITLMMAQHCKSAVGIEIVPAAVENARANAARNGIPNTEFHAGKAEALLPRMVKDGLRSSVIVVDPPRKGLEPEVIRAIAEAAPDRVVYVSCNPATLARDAGRFADAGYEMQKIQPVDMFCWTSGIENVALLSRKMF